MKHIEQVLPKEVITQIQPLRNLEKPEDLKLKMNLLIEIYSDYIRKLCQKNNLVYDSEIEDTVRARVVQFLKQ